MTRPPSIRKDALRRIAELEQQMSELFAWVAELEQDEIIDVFKVDRRVRKLEQK